MNEVEEMATSGNITPASPARSGSASALSVIITTGHTAVVDRVVQAIERCWKSWKETYLPGVGLDREGRPHFPAGLVPTLVREAAHDGYTVEIQDERREDTTDYGKLLEGAEGGDRRYLEALVKNPLGAVEVANNDEVVRRLVQLAALHRQAPVVVTVATRKLAWKVWQALQEKLPYAVGLVTAKKRRPGRRCVVCSYRMLKKLAQEEGAVLAVVEAERATATLADVVVGNPAWSRVYGFVYADVTRDEHADLHLKALAGELIHATPRTAAPKRVLLVPSASAPVKSGGRGLERKRRTIWKNRPRNRRVAQVAQALLAKDFETLRECGLYLDLAELEGMRRRRVAVLVESTAHARELRSLLRGWPIHHMVPLELRKPEAAESNQTAAEGFIVTLLYGGLEGVDADVIVRATGGQGEWVVEESLEEKLGDKTTSTLIIDFDDAFDQQARNDTRLRMHDYRHRRWAVEGVPALG